MSLCIGVGVGAHFGNATPFPMLSLFENSEEGVWYDPTDISTLFQDAAGSTPVTTSGQPVGRILDKSGNGNHATQTTNNARPVYTEGNGLAWLEFDGSNDFMFTGDIDFSGSDEMTVMVGMRKDGDTSASVVELSADYNSNQNTFRHWVYSQYQARSRGGAVSNTNQSAAAAGYSGVDTAVITSTHDISGDLTILRRNGVQIASATGNKGSGNFGNYPLYIGSRGGTASEFDGRIYGLIVRGALTTGSDLAGAEAYLTSNTN